MKVYRAEQIRNVALISHVGAGKTSLVDAALYDSGAVTRQGKVDDGTSISDYDPDELKRHMSLNVKVLPVEWKDHKINFIDTPGYADFVGEVKAGLRVADAALVVVTAEKGVEVGTELTWQYADERKLPRMVFVNKLDRENTSFDQAWNPCASNLVSEWYLYSFLSASNQPSEAWWTWYLKKPTPSREAIKYRRSPSRLQSRTASAPIANN